MNQPTVQAGSSQPGEDVKCGSAGMVCEHMPKHILHCFEEGAHQVLTMPVWW